MARRVVRGRSLYGVIRMKKLLAVLARASVGFALLAAPAAAQTIPSGLFGSINYWGVGGLSQVLNPGLAGQCLQTQGVGSAPVWAPCPGSSLAFAAHAMTGREEHGLASLPPKVCAQPFVHQEQS
jgi:hypothetical protein